MPKSTFFNLPEQKRDVILQSAAAEFASQGYKAASVNRIVDAAQIAKGSFYQYFQDKDDLYAYIVEELIGERKLAAFRRLEPRLAGITLTSFLRMAFHEQLRQFEENPALMRIGIEFPQLSGEPVYRRIMRRYQDRTDVFFLPYIQAEQSRGELDPHVNPFMLSTMLMALGQYMNILILHEGLTAVNETMIDSIVDDLEYILKNGIFSGIPSEEG